MRRSSLFLATILALLTAACDDASDPAPPVGAWVEVPSSAALDEVDRQRLATARKAAQQLGRTLQARLLAALDEGDFAEAIDVCREAAPRIAADVERATGLRVGRTSHALRNPANAPPAWARDVVAGLDADSPLTEPRTFRAPDGRLGVLLPIRTATLCISCHGADGALADGVLSRLAETYPDDRARGFEAGDLRGLFWIEVPATEE